MKSFRLLERFPSSRKDILDSLYSSFAKDERFLVYNSYSGQHMILSGPKTAELTGSKEFFKELKLLTTVKLLTADDCDVLKLSYLTHALSVVQEVE